MLTMRPRRAPLEVGQAEAGEPDDRDEEELDGGLDLLGVEPVRGVLGGPPELFTRMSIPPKASTARRTSRSRSVGAVTSPRPRARRGAPPRARAAQRLRANIATFAPSSASASAIPSPIPADAPQTIAVRPRSPRSIPYFFFRMPTTSRTAAADAFSIFFSSGGQLEDDDLLDAAGAELRRDAHVQAR